MTHAYLTHLQGPVGETWQQALDRFGSACLALREFAHQGTTYELLLDEYYRDGSILEHREPLSADLLAQIEQRLGLPLPPGLKALLQAPFDIHDVRADDGRYGGTRHFSVDLPIEGSVFPQPLCTAISWNYGEDFAEDMLSTAQRAQIDARYFCFARVNPDDHRFNYLLLDREHGTCGIYDFNTESYPKSMAKLKPLLDGEPLRMSVDEVVVQAINQALLLLLERNELPTP